MTSDEQRFDPVEELLKAIGIVHGPEQERWWRCVLMRAEMAGRKALEDSMRVCAEEA